REDYKMERLARLYINEIVASHGAIRYQKIQKRSQLRRSLEANEEGYLVQSENEGPLGLVGML
ncbi:hypothetical protein Tco_0623725, partial [Tanacetum coccineum]